MKKNVTERFFGLAGEKVSSYCGDKDVFLGKYHGYGNPQGVVSEIWEMSPAIMKIPAALSPAS